MAEFPDIIACVSCDIAFFLNEEEQISGVFSCPHCKHDHNLGEIQPVDEPRADPLEVESKPPPEEPSEPELTVGDPVEEALFFDDAVEEPTNDESSGETPDEVIEPQVEEADIAEETEAEAVPPEPVELADVFGCVFCDRALFLNEAERASGDFTCPHCKHENSAADTRAVAAKQLEAKGENVATPAPEQKFEELIECPDCEKAIKLMLEQRDDDSVTCPYCKATIAAPEPPAEEEPEDEVVEEVVEEVAEPEVGEVAESESVGGEEAAKADTADEPEPAVAAGEAEEEPLFTDEDGGVEESPAESEEAKADGDDESSGDDTAIPAESPEPEEAENEVDMSLLESLIQSSRNQSLMPEKFSCPKCETEIQLPEAERMMGLCFCTECEELIESKTAYEHITEEPEPVEAEKVGESAEVEGGDTTGKAKPEEPDVAAAKEEAAAEMEFWLNNVLPNTVDCAKCSNNLKLEDEEKMFGIYRCPYCKAGINHAKGTVVESLGSSGDAEDEGEEVVKKRKPIKFKALLPYAAVFVFGVALNYGVIWVSDYLQEQKAHKAEWVTWLKAAQLEMKERPEVYQDALEDGKNKEAFGRLGEMSHDKLKAFRERLIESRKDSYANWFQDTGDKITKSVYGPVVQGFQRKLNRFIRWVKLAKIDADNLETAFGMNSFERRKAHDLLNTHIVSIREQMDALSTDKAIELGLVRPEVLSALMEMSLEVDNFQMKSVKQIVVHLSSMTNKARALESRYRLSHPSADRLDEYGGGDASHSHSEPGTPWNAEVYQWKYFNEERKHGHHAEWQDIAAEYGNLMDSFSDFYRQLETLKRDPDLSNFQHPFLEGGVLALRVGEFQELEGAGDLVSNDARNRLEGLAKLLDPYASGSLANDLKTKKTSGTHLTHDQADELYERFWEQWKQFHLEKQWFQLEGVSSYYHLSRIGEHSSHNSAGEHH